MGPEAYTILGDPLYEKEHKFTNKKLGTKVNMNIYFGPLSGPWKGALQVMGPGPEASLASR